MNPKETSKNHLLNEVWSLILLRGIILILLGIVMLAYPGATLTVLIIMMGAWWLVDGIVTIVKSIKGRKELPAWGWGIFTGILGILAGIIVLAQPLVGIVLTTTFLIWFLAIAALLYGINGIVTGIRLRKEIKGEWSMVIGGILSMIFGIVLMVNPLVSAVTLVISIGVIAIIGGIVISVLAFTVRKKQ